MAKKGAHVRSIDAVRAAKAAIVEFREAAGGALAEATTDVQRTIWWIRNDRAAHWKRELKRRTEAVANARADLERARLGAFDQQQSFTDQKKAIDRALRAQAEAEEKIRAVERWARELDRAFMLYRGKCAGLAHTAEGDLRRGESKLELAAERLETYLRETLASVAPRRGRTETPAVGSSRVDLQACKLEYSIVSPK